ncbi:hypothetical protein [Marinobacter sp. X15-166B]|uniref:hypothetical protein n=1 Tax=Marinobacter sp. X15-166B TaxID=1897620 RepID=UPI00085BEF89|nr:hypothetical protein [Marinobacter sp. X15-166B]OEY66813.1 hypothetical protein BG841_10340 [Marinobacter sp. X15-166B]
MIQLTAIVKGTASTVLTGRTLDEAAESCRDRFGNRFEGFAPMPLEVEAGIRWIEYRERRTTRVDLEAWLSGLDEADERAARDIFNSKRSR